MAGHSKWKNIKQKKDRADQERGKLFSKLSQNISIAAKGNPDPKFNPTLRSAIDQAKKANMPQANIERAINKANDVGDQEELILEIYGPEGIGILAKAMTDNKNRTLAELKVILKNNDAKLGDPGSLAWAFEKSGAEYTPKFTSPASDTAKDQVDKLVSALKDHSEVEKVYTTIA